MTIAEKSNLEVSYSLVAILFNTWITSSDSLADKAPEIDKIYDQVLMLIWNKSDTSV
jgi:hypothetical protein